jgi:hypothetical protein
MYFHQIPLFIPSQLTYAQHFSHQLLLTELCEEMPEMEVEGETELCEEMSEVETEDELQ